MIDQPVLNPIPFATNGDKNPIPDTAGGGSASFQYGFPQLTMTPINQGGIPPSGEDMNGILNHLDKHVVWQTAGMGYVYDANFAQKIGGYAKGAVLRSKDGLSLYTSTADANLTDPESAQAANWSKLGSKDFLILSQDYPPVLGCIVQTKIDPYKPSLKFGLKGDGLFDDGNNNFRGLPNPNEPWADENTGIGSVMFGRDNATPAYLSLTNGHGNSTYGAASFAGGAGSGTGNPDVPSDDANYGYCSIAYGKLTTAKGRISTAFGEENQANSVHSYSSGAESRSGAGLATHPNILGGSGVVSDGDCAYSHGWRAYAYGDYSIAMGYAVSAYNSSMCFGSGVNAGTRLDNTLPNSIAMGYGVSIPTIIMSKNDGTVAGFGKLGINTKNPTERVDINIQSGDKVSISTAVNGTGIVDLQGKLANGSNASIFRIEYNSPNAGSAYGVTKLYQNSNLFLSVDELGDTTFNRTVNSSLGFSVAGKRIIGGQQAAIANTDGSTADNARAINAILAAMRSHGLIAS